MELSQIHNEVFYPDDAHDIDIIFNKKLRLFIVAEEISGTVRDTVVFLNKYGIDIKCLKYDVFCAGNGSYYISTEIEAFSGGFVNTNVSSRAERWSGNEPIKVVTKRVVDRILLNKKDKIFTMKEVMECGIQMEIK